MSLITLFHKNIEPDRIKFLLGNCGNVIKLRNTKVSLEGDVLRIEHGHIRGESVTEYLDPDLLELNIPTISELKVKYFMMEERGSPDYYYYIMFQL